MLCGAPPPGNVGTVVACKTTLSRYIPFNFHCMMNVQVTTFPPQCFERFLVVYLLSFMREYKKFN